MCRIGELSAWIVSSRVQNGCQESGSALLSGGWRRPEGGLHAIPRTTLAKGATAFVSEAHERIRATSRQSRSGGVPSLRRCFRRSSGALEVTHMVTVETEEAPPMAPVLLMAPPEFGDGEVDAVRAVITRSGSSVLRAWRASTLPSCGPVSARVLDLAHMSPRSCPSMSRRHRSARRRHSKRPR